jgi:SAM-dependent methyltransferase
MAINNLVEGLIHALRYREVRPYLKPCRRMADLGCRWDYAFLKEVRATADGCWGLDLDVKDGADGNITLMRRDITKPLPFENAFFDQITSLAVLEHIEDPRPILKECLRVLTPGGRLILTTPTHMGIHVHDVLLKAGLVRDVEPGEHKDFSMSKAVLSDWAREAGFVVESAHTFECGMNLFLCAAKPA